MKIKLLIIFGLVFLSISFAQKGDIKGKIVDKQTKQPLIGANIIVMDTDFGTATDEKGIFIIKDVPENVYKLRINYIGYNTHIEPDIRVIRNKTFFVKEIDLVEVSILTDEVTVTSGYYNDLKDMPVSQYSFTKEEIIRAPGAAGDVFRAIESIPGVSGSGGEFSSFSVRGGAPKDNIILVDNIPFSNVSHFVESGGNEEIQGGRFSIFTMGLIEKANFQGGAFSAKYGGKKASFLDLSIKEGNKESFTANASYDLLGWEVNYDGPVYILPNTGIVVSARSQDFKTVLDMMDEIGHGHPKLSDYLFKISSDLSADHKVSLLGLYSTERMIRDLYHLYKSKNMDSRGLVDEREEKLLFGLNWRYLTGKTSYLNTSIYYGNTDQLQKEGRAYTDPVNGVVPTQDKVFVRNPIGKYDSDEIQYGVKTDFSYNINKNITFNAGINLQQIKKNSKTEMFGKDTLYVYNRDEIKTGDPKYLIIDPSEIQNDFNKKRTELAIYAETGIDLNEQLHINTGLRYEYDNLSCNSYLSPRISGSYQVNPVTSLNFAAGLHYQLPEMLLLSADKRNTNLKSEKAYHLIFGMTHYLTDDIKLTAETYYKSLRDLIVRPNSNNGLAENAGKGYAYGADFSLMKRFVNKVYGQINYSYGVCKIKENETQSYFNYDFNQTHIFNILVGWQINDNFSVSAKWKYATGRPKDNYSINQDVLNNRKMLRYSMEKFDHNSDRYNDFHSLNLRIDYRKQFTNHLAIVAFIDILNLYDNENTIAERLIEYTGKIEKESMSMVPTIGIKLEI